MQMEPLIIKDSFKSQKGEYWNIVYKEVESFDEVRDIPIKSVGGISIFENKMVLVYAKKRLSWEMPGGSLEKGESIEEGFARELREEANMRIIKLWPLGYDTLTNKHTGFTIHQMRVACIAEPIGPFEGDPDGDITEIQTIDPKEYKRFFNWGKRSDAMIEKALRVINTAQ